MKKTYTKLQYIEAERVSHWSTFPGVCTRITSDYNTGRILEREPVIDLSPDGSGMWRAINEGDWVITCVDGSTNVRSVMGDADFHLLYKEAK